MTVACCVLSILAMLHQLELREKYGYRGTWAGNSGEAVVISYSDHALLSSPLAFDSVPGPLNDGWLGFEKRIGLQKPNEEAAEPLPAWLEGGREYELQIRRFRRTQIGIMMQSDGYTPIGPTYMPVGPTLFEDGWESFNNALWDSLKSVPRELRDQRIESFYGRGLCPRSMKGQSGTSEVSAGTYDIQEGVGAPHPWVPTQSLRYQFRPPILAFGSRWLKRSKAR